MNGQRTAVGRMPRGRRCRIQNVTGYTIPTSNASTALVAYGHRPGIRVGVRTAHATVVVREIGSGSMGCGRLQLYLDSGKGVADKLTARHPRVQLGNM